MATLTSSSSFWSKALVLVGSFLYLCFAPSHYPLALPHEPKMVRHQQRDVDVLDFLFSCSLVPHSVASPRIDALHHEHCTRVHPVALLGPLDPMPQGPQKTRCMTCSFPLSKSWRNISRASPVMLRLYRHQHFRSTRMDPSTSRGCLRLAYS
jgi:hypothetical protein